MLIGDYSWVCCDQGIGSFYCSAGGTQRLPRIIGISRAKELIFTAKRIKAEEAAQIGLVNHCVEEGKGFEKAIEIAKQISANVLLSI